MDAWKIAARELVSSAALCQNGCLTSIIYILILNGRRYWLDTDELEQTDNAMLNFVEQFSFYEKCVLCRNYVRYLYQTIAFVFNIVGAIKRGKFHLSSVIITIVSLFG